MLLFFRSLVTSRRRLQLSLFKITLSLRSRVATQVELFILSGVAASPFMVTCSPQFRAKRVEPSPLHFTNEIPPSLVTHLNTAKPQSQEPCSGPTTSLFFKTINFIATKLSPMRTISAAMGDGWHLSAWRLEINSMKGRTSRGSKSPETQSSPLIMSGVEASCPHSLSACLTNRAKLSPTFTTGPYTLSHLKKTQTPFPSY